MNKLPERGFNISPPPALWLPPPSLPVPAPEENRGTANSYGREGVSSVTAADTPNGDLATSWVVRLWFCAHFREGGGGVWSKTRFVCDLGRTNAWTG